MDRLATLALGPLLLAQGRRVRRDTPRLAEAAGPREGLVEPPGASTGALADPLPHPDLLSHPHPSLHAPLRLLIAGDSSAAGVGVTDQADALAGLLPQRLAQAFGRPVQWRLVARTGVDVNGLIGLLARLSAERYDLAVVAIGVNDVTARTPPARWRARLDALDATLRERFGAPALYVGALPPMHRFPALPQPLRWYLGRHARRLDTELAGWAASRAPRVRRVETALPESGATADLVAADGFHPGALAYRLWADALTSEIERSDLPTPTRAS